MAFGHGGHDGPREMHDATCSDCGASTQVPFRPSQGRPVYCRDCFSSHRPERGDGGGGRGAPRGGPRGGDRELHDAVCAECGTQTQVPFKPTSGRPVFCRDCFQSQRR